MLKNNPMSRIETREKHLRNLERGEKKRQTTNRPDVKEKHRKGISTEKWKNAHSGKNNCMKKIENRKKLSETRKRLGLGFTDEMRKNAIKSTKGKTYDEIHGEEKGTSLRRNRREIAIKRIEMQLKNEQPLMPAIGNYETSILNNLENCFGYPITRQKRVAGYFLDGYCSMFKLAIEVDEPHHFNINGKLRQRDIIRQKEIEKEIGCIFLRIKVPNKVMPY